MTLPLCEVLYYTAKPPENHSTRYHQGLGNTKMKSSGQPNNKIPSSTQTTLISRCSADDYFFCVWALRRGTRAKQWDTRLKLSYLSP
eukprot:5302618-Amphidinium_carterae.1